jgi:hypothetical protein
VEKTTLWTRIALALVGAGGIALALAASGWGWRGFSPFSLNQLVLIGLSALLFSIAVLGERFPGSQLLKGYQSLGVIVLNTLVFLLVLEMTMTVVLNLRSVRTGTEDFSSRADYQFFQSQEWGLAYLQENAQVEEQYIPFVTWRSKPLAGEFVTINDDGIRLTPGAACEEEALKVFVFGGSAVWGLGAPNNMTIPGYLQQILEQQQTRPVCVVNYGQLGYVTTQEVMTLIERLHSGDVPDIAVFYNGYNDMFAAYQSGQAGVHQNLDSFVRNLEPETVGSTVLAELLKTSTYGVVRSLVNPVSPTGSTRLEGVELDALSDEVARIYVGNYQVIDALAQAYGFDYVFLLQSNLFETRKPLIPLEQLAFNSWGERLDTLSDLSYTAIRRRAEALPHFTDLTRLFDDREGFFWIDEVHIIPEGNQIAANRIAEIIAPMIEAQETEG